MRRPVFVSLLIALAALTAHLRAADAPAAAPAPAPAPAPGVKKGTRLAVVGDSITEQKQYSRFIETYLTGCCPQLEVKVAQFGWSGETAAGFAARMANSTQEFSPDLVTLCYGMNDAGYQAFDPNRAKPYEKALRDTVAFFKAKQAIVLVGSPGAVDFQTFKRGGADGAKVYNETLRQFGQIGKTVAGELQMPFADVHGPMVAAMEKAQAAYGQGYDVCGPDGFHPRPNGHLVMAYAFLKGLGLDGQLGTVTMDLKAAATATDGHRVVTAEKGKVELESSRYPFCFFGGPKDANGTRSIVPYVPFNEELNRFLLVVKNLDQERAKVTWGGASKEFTRAQLEAGINLAAEFLDNPFRPAFQKVDQAVADKQNYETWLVKTALSGFAPMQGILADDQEGQAALTTVRRRLWAKDEAKAAAVRALVVPVKHTLVVEPIAPVTPAAK